MTILVRNRSARGRCAMAAVAALAMAALAAPVQAQSLKDLSGALGSVTAAAGVCRRWTRRTQQPDRRARILPEEQISGGGNAATGSSLLGKLTGSGKASDDSAFKAGSGGMLETGGGDTFSLGGSGIQEKATEQVCKLVLEHAQSLL